VQAIVRELSNERIDIINWTEEMSLLVRRVFSPAEVKRVIPVGFQKITVVISEEDLAQAIGREGQNIRLASKMLDKEIDVFGDEEFSNMTEEERTAALSEKPKTDPAGEQGAAPAPADGELSESEAGADDEAVVVAETDGDRETEEEPVLGEIAAEAIDTLATTDDDSEDAIERAALRQEESGESAS
jgi:N utilization substance protein A